LRFDGFAVCRKRYPKRAFFHGIAKPPRTKFERLSLGDHYRERYRPSPCKNLPREGSQIDLLAKWIVQSDSPGASFTEMLNETFQNPRAELPMHLWREL
jgi:hypothetical protein